MRRLLLSSAAFASIVAFATSAWADKIAVLPFTSPKNVPKPELEEARRWTREAVVKAGHSFATDSEMVSAEMVVKDGLADTSQEYLAAGRAVGAAWTLTGRVERDDHPPAKLPDGSDEAGYTTYRLELEACQVGTGRVESLSREILPEEGPSYVTDMIGLLVRPEGLANAEIPWERTGVGRPKPKPKATPEPTVSVQAPAPRAPEAPAEPYPVYGDKHPVALGASIGFTTAIARPGIARGPSGAMPIGAVFGYALAESVPGLELKANVTSQVLGPRALELSAGARYAFAPIRGVRWFIGPELLLGGHVALGADKTTRFITHGELFLAAMLTDNIQAEVAGDLATAFGGSGTLVLGGATARIVVRF
ncbi:MAG TPA: hypothetical protein VM580_11770 [Labilithrix sp.]|nr:hypothetical protein [Labilithrix sp.]